MAKRIKRLKNLLIKETTPRDETIYKYWVTLLNGDLDWECDSIGEAENFINTKDKILN